MREIRQSGSEGGVSSQELIPTPISRRNLIKALKTMARSLSAIFLHVIFSTKNRLPYLCEQGVEEELHRYIGGILNRQKSQLLAIGGTADHVHLLADFSRDLAISDVIKEVKRGSSLWIKTQGKIMQSLLGKEATGCFPSLPLK